MPNRSFSTSVTALFGGCRCHVPLLTAGLLTFAALPAAHAQLRAPLAPGRIATVSVPDNLTNGLQGLVQDYLAAKSPGTATASAAQSAVVSALANYPRARADAADRVIVDIYLDGKDSINSVVAKLEALGCKIESRLDWYGNGALAVWLPLDQAIATGNLRGVHHVNLALKPTHHVGKVTSQGAFVLRAEALQGAPANSATPATTTPTGNLGYGVTVGALSDSFNMLKTTGTGTSRAPLYANVKAADDVASYDLPGSATNPFGNTTPVNVLKDYTSSNGVEDEGRGMLQLIHDVAPQAKLAFYTADVSEVDFAAGIIALQQQAGCNVICDDVGYFDEPMFSDGPVGQAIDRVVAAGAVYTSSAGNDDASGYAATFAPVANNSNSQALLAAQGVTYGGLSAAEQSAITDFHSFGKDANGKDILVQNVRIPGTSADSAGYMEFQWDDPYVTLASQGATNNVTTDFDILVFDGATGAILTGRSGMTNNYTSKVPIERPNTTLAAATNYKIVIARTNRAAASATPNQATHLRYAVQTNDTPLRGDFINLASPESHGHNCATGCIGTAAYRYDASPVADVHSSTHAPYPIVEQFSSNGPTTVYFDASGNRTPGVTRKQPVLAATDGASTSFFPPDSVTSGTTPPAPPGPSNPSPSDFNGDGYPNFFGTSAAAPHAAAVAAILLGVAKQNNIALAPSDVRTLMINTTQANQDQNPNQAVASVGPATIVASGYARTDNNAYTVSYKGNSGSKLTTIVIDLSPIGAHFDPTTSIPTDTSTTATASGVVVSAFNGTTTPAGTTAPSVASYTVGTGINGTTNSQLTIQFNNFNPGATLKFGIGRRNDGVNVFSQLAEVLGGQTPTSPAALFTYVDGNASSSQGSTVQFVNTFSKKWNYKEGYGLIDAQAAVKLLLSSVSQPKP